MDREEGEAGALGQGQRLQWLPGQGLGVAQEVEVPKAT